MSGVRKAGGSAPVPGLMYAVPKTREVEAAEPAVSGDSTGITGAARELRRALEIVEVSDEVRAERVQALREQIQNGQYNPDPREIAKKLLERGL